VNGRQMLTGIKLALVVASLGVTMAGCTYDYLNHSDRIAYSAGDAVNANLERETINPSKKSMYLRWGLGRNGSVIPKTTTATTTATVGATTSTAAK
jgi:hypothetical protein